MQPVRLFTSCSSPGRGGDMWHDGGGVSFTVAYLSTLLRSVSFVGSRHRATTRREWYLGTGLPSA